MAIPCGSRRPATRWSARGAPRGAADGSAAGRVRGGAPLGADGGAVAEVEGLVERVHHEFGRLDVFFCTAGGPPAAPFRSQSAEAFQRALELNLLSVVHLCRAAVPLMRKQQWGRIVCLTSVAAKQPLPGLILSTPARAGVLGFAKALADEGATA